MYPQTCLPFLNGGKIKNEKVKYERIKEKRKEKKVGQVGQEKAMIFIFKYNKCRFFLKYVGGPEKGRCICIFQLAV